MANSISSDIPLRALNLNPISRLVDSIGTGDFSGELLQYTNEKCGAEHCSVFEYKDSQLKGRGAASLDRSLISLYQSDLYVSGDYWRRDPGLLEGQQLLVNGPLGLIRQDLGKVSDVELRERIWSCQDVRHRVLLCSGTPERALIVSLCRTGETGDFSSEDLHELVHTGAAVAAVVRKHAAISWTVPRFPAALTNLAAIEDCMANVLPRLPRREFQVCARLIYGMTTCGIALDLGIGEGSVMTYRKRTYERLHIGSQRELLVWYLGIWEKTFGDALVG